ncbi:MAG TPA: HEAT repeat domain-containing protein, partial [Roseiflexaceae bacterium]|nr:HEAT repeat domain-containing protein [Roseiflexaceae bacterium]
VPAMLAELAGDNPAMQLQVIQALGKLTDERVEAALAAALKDVNPYIRYASIQALSEVGTRESLPALVAIQLHDEHSVNLHQGFQFVSLKSAAASAIQKIRTRHSLTA